MSIFNNNILTNDLFPNFLENLYPSDIICLSFTNKELFHKISKYLTQQKHWYHPSLHSLDTRNQLDYVFESLCNIYKTIALQKSGRYPLGINRSYFCVSIDSIYGSNIISTITQTLEQSNTLNYCVAWPMYTNPFVANKYSKEVADSYQHVEEICHGFDDSDILENNNTINIFDERFHNFDFDTPQLTELGILYIYFLSANIVEVSTDSFDDDNLSYDHNEGTESSEESSVVEYDYNEGTESSEEYDYDVYLDMPIPYIRKDDGTDITLRQYQNLPVVELVCPRCNNHFFDKDLGGNICCFTPDDLW